MTEVTKLTEIIGKTFSRVKMSEDKDRIEFTTEEGFVWAMFHGQDCCEIVLVEDVTGDLSDLVGSPVLTAEERSEEGEENEGATSTWTFYVLATAKGTVTIRWLGRSNGYYSERVFFERQGAKS
jgi:hypothetical protein